MVGGIFSPMKKLGILLLLVSCMAARPLTYPKEADKLRRRCIDEYPQPTITATISGVDGVIHVQTINGCDNSPVDEECFKASVNMTFPIPSAIAFRIIEASDGGTLSCTKVKISGTNQFGQSDSETVETVGESDSYTTSAFAHVKTIQALGCVNGAEAGDILRAAVSPKVGFEVPLRKADDIEALCIQDVSDGSKLKCAPIDDGTAADIESATDIYNSHSDLSVAMFGDPNVKVALGAGDRVCYSVRHSWR